MGEVCGVPDCEALCGDRRPVCSRHWAMSPYFAQQAWWRQYREGGKTTEFVRSMLIEYGTAGGPPA